MNHPPIRASADREFRRVAEQERDEARELLQKNVAAKWELLSECQELHRKLAEARAWSAAWKKAAKFHRQWSDEFLKMGLGIRGQCNALIAELKSADCERCTAESAARSWRTVALVTLAVLVGYVVVVGIVAVSL